MALSARTIRDFTTEQEIWPTVEAWAQQEGYNLVETTGTQRLYQKGKGMMTAPMMCQLEQTGSQVHMEVWVRVSFFVRLQSLFMLPAQMGVESGGMRGVVPRKMARNSVNKLLEQLGQPLIE